MKTQTNPVDSFVYWRNLADASLVGSVSAEKKDEIAWIAMEQFRREKSAAIWHAASVAFGTLEKCQCYPCAKARVWG